MAARANQSIMTEAQKFDFRVCLVADRLRGTKGLSEQQHAELLGSLRSATERAMAAAGAFAALAESADLAAIVEDGVFEQLEFSFSQHLLDFESEDGGDDDDYMSKRGKQKAEPAADWLARVTRAIGSLNHDDSCQ